MNAPGSRFCALDTLRGPAALCIAVFHFDDQWAGYLAVEFFFVLSGFLLAHGMSSRSRNMPVGLFLARRCARLYPMHLYGLATFAFSAWLLTGTPPTYPDGTFATLLQQITLTHGVGLNPHGLTWNYPSWAISVEFWAGLIVFLLLARRVGNMVLLPCALVCFGLIGWHNGSLATHYENYYSVVNSGLLRGIGSLLLGAVAYRIYQHLRLRKWTRGRLTLLELACVVATLLLIVCRSQVTSPTDFLVPFVFMASTVAFAFEGGLVSELLCKFSGIGVMSFSVYINQATVLLWLHPLSELYDLPMAVGLSAYLVILIVYSYATYRLIERPARRMAMSKIDRWSLRNG